MGSFEPHQSNEGVPSPFVVASTLRILLPRTLSHNQYTRCQCATAPTIHTTPKIALTLVEKDELATRWPASLLPNPLLYYLTWFHNIAIPHNSQNVLAKTSFCLYCPTARFFKYALPLLSHNIQHRFHKSYTIILRANIHNTRSNIINNQLLCALAHPCKPAMWTKS